MYYYYIYIRPLYQKLQIKSLNFNYSELISLISITCKIVVKFIMNLKFIINFNFNWWNWQENNIQETSLLHSGVQLDDITRVTTTGDQCLKPDPLIQHPVILYLMCANNIIWSQGKGNGWVSMKKVAQHRKSGKWL